MSGPNSLFNIKEKGRYLKGQSLQDSVIKAYKVILKASMGQRIMNKT
jgi:hypothetical protein